LEALGGGDEWAQVQKTSGTTLVCAKGSTCRGAQSPELSKHGFAVQALVLTFIGHLSPGVPTVSVWALRRATRRRRNRRSYFY